MRGGSQELEQSHEAGLLEDERRLTELQRSHEAGLLEDERRLIGVTAITRGRATGG